VEDVGFGRYGSDAVAMDDCLHRNPQVLAVAAAGNDRSDAPPVQPISHYVIGTHPTTEAPVWVIAGDYRNPDGFDHGGLDTITGLGLAKNTLCVGAINDLFSEGQPISGATIQSTYFSGWGPADDGRIKPDVVANGESLVSPTIPPPGASAPDGVYVELSGTSMASPTACGIAAVLAEFIRDRHGAPPAAAQVKAVMIHSATDAGPPGPDPIFGWGSVHAFRAGELIAGQSGAVLPMAGVREGDSKRHEFEASGGPVRVTLVWTDPPGQPNGGPLDDPTSALTNDLDLTLTTPEGKVLHPYRLVRAGPDWVSRTDEPNHVDNVEVIDAPDQAGAWAVTVRGTDLRVGDEQSFALCVTGLRPPA
jgi:subtilisin family serine protease